MTPAAYLARLGYDGPLAPTADTLRRLQVAHLMAVPFENLSIHEGEPIVLEDEALFDKIVVRRRGGFCYELNGLFAWLLRALGFEVTRLAAEVFNARGEWGRPFDHMTLQVALEEPWLVDVGFGDSFLEPLRLEPGREQAQGSRAFRLDPVAGRLILQRREGGSAWTPQYRFDLRAFDYADYAATCRYHETSPDSHFTRNRICTLATADGRITLSGLRMIVSAGGVRRETELAGRQGYLDALRESFGIVLAAS